MNNTLGFDAFAASERAACQADFILDLVGEGFRADHALVF